MSAIAVSSPSSPLVERVQPLLPEIRERAPEFEEARQIPSDIIEKLVEIGFYRAAAPAMYGGHEVDFYDWVQTVRLLAQADPATGWVAGVTGCHTWGLAFFDKRVQDEVWEAGPDTIMSTSGLTGKVTREDGGIRMAGRFSYSSGCDHASWVMLGFVVEEGDDSKEPGLYFAMVPRSEWEIDDDWFTFGMRGTGSKTIVVDDAFVPEYRWFGPGFETGSLCPGLHASPKYNTLFAYFMQAPFVAVCLGAAEGALEVATTSLKSRMSVISQQRTADYPPRQIRLAEAALQIDAAAALMDRSLRRLVDSLDEGRCLSAEGNRWLRAHDAYVARLARQAVEHLVSESGGGETRSSKPLQRFWRDIYAGSQHPYLDVVTSSHTCGRLLMGLPLDDVPIL